MEVRNDITLNVLRCIINYALPPTGLTVGRVALLWSELQSLMLVKQGGLINLLRKVGTM